MIRQLKLAIPTMVTDLSGSINLGLPDILTLAKHGRSYKLIPVLLADEIRGLEKNGRAVWPRHGFPLGPGSEGPINSSCNSYLIRLVV
jgi:hypothetical protein